MCPKLDDTQVIPEEEREILTDLVLGVPSISHKERDSLASSIFIE